MSCHSLSGAGRIARRFTAIRNPAIPIAMKPTETRISMVAGKYKASGLGTECQCGRAKAGEHTSQRTEDVAQNIVCLA